MKRLVSLAILSKTVRHTSPVMLITRMLTKDKRQVVHFRLLNTRILRRNTSIPLMSDALSMLGNSECEVVSCVDIKDAYHSIRLTAESKDYCGILLYFGSPIYRYEVLPVGIACAPHIWMDYFTLILSELEDKKKYIAIIYTKVIIGNYWSSFLSQCIRMDLDSVPRSVNYSRLN